MTIGGLAGHTSRAILQVEQYLDGPLGDGDRKDAADYFGRLGDPSNLDSDINTAIRDRSEAAASGGPVETSETAAACLARLVTRFPDEPDDRLVEAFGSVISLDDYLDTRLVEMAIHHDDLTLSLGISTESPSSDAQDRAIEVLLEIAKRRHGRSAVLASLTRRERDQPEALRVF